MKWLHTTFNQHFKTILDAWNAFLKTPESLDKPGSWISQAAYKAGVWQDMQFVKALPGYGFANWNAFFIRKFVNDIALQSEFWIKTVNYRLLDLFGGQVDWARFFEGGQLYQGFLSATHYHCWNSPLDGEIVRSWVQPGTYFAQRPGQGENQGNWEGTESEPYLGHVAARAIFIFRHKLCGYVALLCIGMVEVSTCVIKDELVAGENDNPVLVTKGQDIGHFEFGGSTHVMAFQKDRVKLEQWALNASTHLPKQPPTHLGTVIAKPA